MILLKRFLPLITGLLTFAGFEVLIGQPSYFHWLSGVLVVLPVAAVVCIVGWRPRDVFLFVIAPALLAVGTVLLLLFLDANRPIVRHGVVLMTATFLWHYLEQVFAFRFDRQQYQAFALENTAAYMNLGSVFALTAGLFGLRYYLGYPLWILFTLLPACLFLTTYHTLAMSKVGRAPRLRSSLFVAVLGTELGAALAWLPSDQFVNSLFLTAFVYVITSLLHLEFRGALDKIHIRRYMLIGVLVVFLTILTASWR